MRLLMHNSSLIKVVRQFCSGLKEDMARRSADKYWIDMGLYTGIMKMQHLELGDIWEWMLVVSVLVSTLR